MCHLGRDRHRHSSHLSATSHCAGSALSAAEAAAKRKEDNYTEKFSNYHLFPLVFKTFGPINQVSSDFLVHSVNDSPSFNSDDPRETSFLY